MYGRLDPIEHARDAGCRVAPPAGKLDRMVAGSAAKDSLIYSVGSGRFRVGSAGVF
jgi:hypothetical protein